MHTVIERPATRKEICLSVILIATLAIGFCYLTEFLQSQNKRKKGDFEKSMQELDETIHTYRCMPTSQSVMSSALGTFSAPISSLTTIINNYSAVAWQTIGDSK